MTSRPIAPPLLMAAAVFLLYTNLLVTLAHGGLVPTAASALVPLLLMAAVLHRVVIRREPLVVDRTLLLMLAFLCVLLLSAFAAQGYDEALQRIVAFGSEGVMIYFLVRNAVYSRSDLRAAILSVVAAAALLAGLTLYQSATGRYEQDFLGLAQRRLELQDNPTPSGSSEVGLADRAHGPVDDPNRFAQILLMALPFAGVGVLNLRRRAGVMLAGVSASILLGAVFVTYSRGAFLTLLVMVLLAAPLGLIRARSVFAGLAVGVLLIPVIVPGYAARVISMTGVAALFGSTQVEADGPTRGRTTEMLAALAAYTDHAVLGVGPGQYLTYYSVEYQGRPEISIRELAEPRRAHSLYLEIAAETGTLGLLVFLAIPLLLLRDLGRIRRALSGRRPDLARLAAVFTLAIVGYLGTGAFLHLSYERYYWFMIGLSAAAVGVLGRASARLEADVEAEAWPVSRQSPSAWEVTPCSG